MAAAPIHTDLSLQSADGLTLVGHVWTPPSPPKGAAVIVHGLKDHSLRYADLARAWTAQGYGVVAFDLRGHGRSQGRHAYVHRFPQYLDDLGRVMAEARQRFPGAPMTLYGHSLGGAIAASYAIQAQPRLATLILSAPALKPGGKVSGFSISLTKFLGAVAPRAGVFNPPNADFSRDPRVVDEMNQDPMISPKALPARTMAELLRTMAQIRGTGAKLVVPLLILHGTGDKLTSPDGSQELHRTVGSTDKKIVLYPGLFHDLAHEPERAIVSNDALQWMNTHLAA